ncbi:hypothetical protein INT46_008431 [Mucor plumbeus]|jgi:expansin (peptidoglycan-binding protein)|uniref:RlpA-like double-psi beta-barrel-protein domain-containing protein-containing protein n=1 Tax=Mucor plumbeus TaxID=97098 RepID=A0A8H7V6I3_9FUNG|nr:hypothetical protein INT46_008431 [Mucor plumbeus]
MSRTFTLFTAVVLALTALSSAAPIDNNSIVQIESNVAASSSPVQLEKRKKHHKKSKKGKHNKKTTTKKSSSSSSSSSKSYSGTATWFTPASEGGSTGACGPEEGNNSPIVALNAPQYGDMSEKSSWCGKKITITGPAGTATATVNDACPECKTGDLDLTPVLFKKIVGDMDIGVGKISWHLS